MLRQPLCSVDNFLFVVLYFRSIRDEDIDAIALKKMRGQPPEYAWADVEPTATNGKCDMMDKKYRGKETSLCQEFEDTRVWANLKYNDMRDYNRLKSALQIMEQKTSMDARYRDINAKGPGGYTPLMMAVMQTSVAVMRGSLESKEEPMPEGAVANACVSIRDLLGMKADINARNDRGMFHNGFLIVHCICLCRPDSITYSNCLLHQRGCPTIA